MKKQIFKTFVELTGNRFSSTLLKSFSQSKFSKPLIKPFASVYQIDEDEMEMPISSYSSLHAFFTRRLVDGSRDIMYSPSVLTSPVDGVLSDFGEISASQSFLIKNQIYRIEDIMGTAKKAAPYKDGFYYIFYLSPSHYHHFHYPISGKLNSRYALGGISYPVNDLGLRLGQKPFSTNHRIISELVTPFGNVAIVKVGALNVNSIQIAQHSSECTKGDDFGYFSFGSTVLLFLENKECFEPCATMNAEIKMGESIGIWNQ